MSFFTYKGIIKFKINNSNLKKLGQKSQKIRSLTTQKINAKVVSTTNDGQKQNKIKSFVLVVYKI